jgi:PAS domain S-box-containing protein
MRVKRSTDQSITEEGAAQKPKRNPAKALYAGDGRFKSIFDESPIGIELYDSDGLLMDANPACLRIFGVADVAQVKGFKLFEDPNLPDKAKAKLRRGKPVRYEAPFDFEKVKELRLFETAKSGIVHLDVLITPVGIKRKAAPQGYLMQVQDITERKQTEEMLRYHAEELAALQATTLDLAAQQDLLSLLNTIVERAMALLNAPSGFIYLHDAKTNELELVVEKGLPAPLGLRLRMGEGMAGRVAQTRQPLIVDDYSTWEGRSPQYADIPYHAIVEVPMLFGGQLVGVLGVNEMSAATRRYNEADARLLSLFAGQAASVVRNAQLFQGLQSELAERKRTEQALFQTEKRYRTLFEQSPDGILLIDPKTSLPIVFNTAAHSHLGYSREEFARLRIADYEVIEKPEVTEAHIKKIIQEGRDDFETKHRTKQGEIRNVNVTTQTIELADHPVLNCIFRDITERKQAEASLQEAEARYRALVEQNPAIIYTDSAEQIGQTLYISPQIKTILGYEPEEWITDNDLWRKLIQPEDRARVLAEYDRSLETGEPFNAEYRMISRDGRVIWIRDEAVQIRDQSGRPLFWQGVFIDITERKRAEGALLEAETRYRTLVEQITAVTYIDAVDQASSAIFMSPQVEVLSGYTSEEWMADPELWIRLIHPEDRSDVLAEHLRTNETGDPFKKEYRLLTRDGHFVWVRDEAMMLRDEAGQPKCWQGIMLDITERKRAEETLRESEQTYKALIDTTSTGYLIVNPQGQVVDANAEYVRLSGHETLQEILGRSVVEWTAPHDQQRNAAEVEKCAKAGMVRNLEIDYINKNGVITPIEINATVVQTENGTMVLSLCRDITDRKRVEKVQEAIFRISQAAISAENIEELYKTIHQVLGELMPVENFYIALYDPANNLLIFPYFVDQYDQPPQPKKIGRGLTEYVLRTGKPLLAPPEVFDQLLQQGEVELVGTNSVDWLGIPLKVKQQVIGVMVTQSYTEGIRFRQEDADLLTFVSTQVAMAIERKQAEEQIHRHAERLSILNRIARAISTTLNLDDLLEIIYQEITSAIKTEAFFIALYDSTENNLDFRIREDKGIREPQQRRPLGTGLTGQVITSKQPLLISNYEQEKEHLPPIALWGSQEVPQSWLGVPMLLGDKIIGVISVQAYNPNAYGDNEQELLSTIADTVAVAIENAHLYTSLGNEKQRLELLYNLSHHLTESLDSYQVAATALDYICSALGAFKGVIYVPRLDNDRWGLLAASGMKPAELEVFKQYAGMPLASGLTGWAASHKKTAVVPNVAKDKRWETIPGLDEWVRSAMSTPLLAGNTIVGVLNLLSDQIAAFREEDVEIVQAAAASIAVALQNARLYAAEKRRAERFAEIAKIGNEIATMHEASAVLKILVKRAAAIMESTTCTVMLIDATTNEAYLAAQTGLPEGTSPELRVSLELPILRHFVETGEPIILPDINYDAPAMRTVLVRPDIQAFFAYPMIREGRAIGLITFSKLTPYTPSVEEIAACQLLAERAAVALENARLFEETARSLRQVQSLHTIDITIASSFDLRLTLNILLEQTRTQLGVDAVEILVYNPHTQVLDYAAGIGFRTTALQGTHLRLGQGYAGIAGLERKTVHVSNLRGRKTDFLRSPNFSAEGFETYYGVPLIAKGQVKGVLEAFHRSPLKPDQIWTDFLETLAKQAAIAIDNATLFSDLQSSNAELTLAYDTTLTGWSKALDLRDKETEGHTQRVVETTIRLARAMGVIEAELTNVRRGALLHDIGKMGIPDEILHKPGPLSAEEWATMRQHPVHAREMLSPIAYLRPALDIPYNHHEKWDGSGYPNGLKGEQIPLTARIFAAVDVFDALTSDRPYRPAWPREKALDYIREQASKYFDPKVAEVFLKMQQPL